MPTTANLFIPYNWRQDYSEEYSSDESRITAIVDTTWTADNIFYFPQGMMGSNTLAGGSISHQLPEPHPSKPWLYCTEVRLLNGQGAVGATNTGMISFSDGGGRDGSGNVVAGYTPQNPFAVWEVTYEGLQYDLLDDATTNGNELACFVYRNKNYAMDNLPTPGMTYMGATGDEPIKEKGAIHFPLVELEYLQAWRPEPLPEATWATKLGQVNTGSFDTPGIDADPQTVLFIGWDVERVRDAAQNKCSHVKFNLIWRPKITGWNDGGWNAFFRSLGKISRIPIFQKIISVAKTGGVGVPPYTLAGGTDLDGLFNATG